MRSALPYSTGDIARCGLMPNAAENSQLIEPLRRYQSVAASPERLGLPTISCTLF
jgi:hypothetical protein